MAWVTWVRVGCDAFDELCMPWNLMFFLVVLGGLTGAFNVMLGAGIMACAEIIVACYWFK